MQTEHQVLTAFLRCPNRLWLFDLCFGFEDVLPYENVDRNVGEGSQNLVLGCVAE
jgi:hypothetical protein